MEEQGQVLVTSCGHEQGVSIGYHCKDNRTKADDCCTECRKHPALCVGKDQQSHKAESAEHRPDTKKCPDPKICGKRAHVRSAPGCLPVHIMRAKPIRAMTM